MGGRAGSDPTLSGSEAGRLTTLLPTSRGDCEDECLKAEERRALETVKCCLNGEGLSLSPRGLPAQL